MSADADIDTKRFRESVAKLQATQDEIADSDLLSESESIVIVSEDTDQPVLPQADPDNTFAETVQSVLEWQEVPGYSHQEADAPATTEVITQTPAESAPVTIHFDRKSSRPDFSILSGLIDTLSGKDIQIQAHTDDVGGSEYNMMLSQLRAYETFDYLVAAGIPKDRITVRAFGECCAAVPNNTPGNRALNRRVEIRASSTVGLADS